MRLEYYPEDKLKKEVLDVIRKYLDLTEYKVFFFGSRVTNKGSDKSDIDVGIEGKKPISTEILGSIKEEIDDLPILNEIDVVDFHGVSDNFRQVATEKVEYIN